MPEPRELWAKAPAALITDTSLTPTAVRVFLWLDLRAGKRGTWYGQQREIADSIGSSERAVRGAIAQLSRQYIETDYDGRRRATTYRIKARVTGRNLPLTTPSDRQEFAADSGSDRNKSAGHSHGAPFLRSLDPFKTTDPIPDPERAHTRFGSVSRWYGT
jgi:hypothetical protein